MSGVVDSHEERDLAIKLTSNTGCVTKVSHRLVVKIPDEAAALRSRKRKNRMCDDTLTLPPGTMSSRWLTNSTNTFQTGPRRINALARVGNSSMD